MSSMIRGKTRPSCKATAKKVRRGLRFGSRSERGRTSGAPSGAGSACAECAGGESLRRFGGGLFSLTRCLQFVQLRRDVAREQGSEQRTVDNGVQRFFVLQATNLVEACGAFESAKEQLDLPAKAIQLGDVVGREHITGKRGQVVAVLSAEGDAHDADDRYLAVLTQ